MQKPNIILILADDLGYGDVGCYGGTHIHTPCLDAMAQGGLRFTDFHSNGAVCSPTRAALMTGRYQQRAGIEGVISAAKHRQVGMDTSETTFANVLKEAGYATALFGKWHLGYAPEFNPLHQGFDTFRGFVSGNVDYFSHIDQVGYEDWWQDRQLKNEEGYTTDLVTQHGLHFIETHQNQPFCLYLAHECPHYPYQGPNDKGYRTTSNTQPGQGPRQDQDVAYAEMMSAMDRGIGAIVEKVQALNLAHNTFIFFCSDNGPTGPGSAGPLRGGKGTTWEGGHRVPAIAYWPGVIEAGVTTHQTALGMDLFPTFASLAHAPVHRPLDGVDLSPVLKGENDLPLRTLFWRHGKRKAVRYEQWKWVESTEDSGLFNLSDDLGEQNDLSQQMPDKTKEMRRLFQVWEKDVTSHGQMRT
jgi:arylsulfatase A